MIRVAQYEGRIDVFEMFGREGFYCGLRSHRREDRREEVAMRGGEFPSAGAVVFGGDLEVKHWADYTGLPQPASYDTGN